MANSLVIDARTMVKNPTDLVAIDGKCCADGCRQRNELRYEEIPS